VTLEFSESDVDKDGRLTVREYTAEHLGAEEATDDMSVPEKIDFEDWRAYTRVQFVLADANGDGWLSEKEYFDFLHPEESDNPRLHDFLVQQDVHDCDTNGDGGASFDEFYDALYPRFYDSEAMELPEKADEEEEDDEKADEEADKAKAKKIFERLDLDGDGTLTSKEMAGVFDELHPRESKYTSQMVATMMRDADTNKDGKLTLDEMVENSHAFYSIDPAEHDEL
jgi:calumenin